MDLKQFLKPTISKIIIFLVISIVFIPFIRYDNGIRCFTTPCDSDTTGSFAMWLFSSYNYHIYQIHYSYMIFGIVVTYLISCLIALIFKSDKH